MEDQVSSALDSGILTITIQRPKQRNALNHAVIQGLAGAFRRAAGDRAVRVVALTGSGEKVFCAGADLTSALPSDCGGQGFNRSAYRELLLEILHFPKPTVALARGHVLAGGMGILLTCDLALACDDIHFSTPEIHVGMFPMMVLALLFRHVGRKKATEMLFLGERVPAGAARDLGIVSQIYPRAEFDAQAGEFLRKLADKSSRILELGKEAIARTEDRALQEDLQYLESALAEVMSTSDCQEGVQAFLGKRKPQWKDK